MLTRFHSATAISFNITLPSRNDHATVDKGVKRFHIATHEGPLIGEFQVEAGIHQITIAERQQDRESSRPHQDKNFVTDLSIDALTTYALRTSDATALAPRLTALLETASWTDAKALARREKYAHLASDFLAKMDLSKSHVLRFAMEIAHVFQVNGDIQNGKRILSKLPELTHLPDDPVIIKALLKRADTVYPIQDIGRQNMSDFLIERFGSSCSRNAASMWRCAGCMAIKLGRYEDALAYVNEGRNHVYALTNTEDDTIIPLYLDVIEVISKINICPSLISDDDAIRKLEMAIAIILSTVTDYRPLSIGISYELLKLRQRNIRRKSFDIEQNQNKISSMKKEIISSIDNMIKIACFFDFMSIKKDMNWIDE